MGDLQAVFKPRSVALIGASNRPGSIGSVVIKNLFRSGFQGVVLPVNPKLTSIEGVLCYPDVKSLPVTPDLAIFCIPPDGIAAVMRQLGERGTGGVVIISAGFGSVDGEVGLRRKQDVIEVAKEYGMRIIGPNCIGLVIPTIGLNGSFAHLTPDKGDIGFVSQSGAIVTTVLDWAKSKGIGFTNVISMGDMIDIDFGAVIDYLAEDPHTKVIVLYIEAITNARHFMSAARSAARMKPVIVLKSGRNEEGAKAAASHTGALAGMDAVYDAVFQRSGLLRAQDMDELFDAMETLARAQTLRGDRLCILTNGGGLGVLATDALISMGGKLAKLEDKTIAKLNEVLPPTWSHGNPVDIIGDAPGERYANAFRLIMNDPNVDAVLIMNCPVAIASSLEAAEAIVNAYQACNRNPKPTIITCWLGEGAPAQARQLFLEHDIPSYPTPARAVKGFKDMVDYYYNRKMSQVSNNEHANFNSKLAKSIMENALSKGQVWLTEPEAKSVLRAYGIPVLKSQEVPNVEAAYEAARDMEGKMVLKILSPDITHKSDSGGVALNLPSADAVKEAAAQMLERYKVTHPHAKMEGFSLQEMVERPGAHELILGVVDDPVFGPVMLFGTGGKAVEMIKDKALALPPLNAEIAREQIMHTRIYNLLKGYRDEPAVDIDAIVQCLVNLSELIVDFPMIKELDLNPLLVDSKGVVGLDARIKITATPTGPGDSRLVITPYPRSMEKEINIAGRGNLFLRPVKVEDEGNLCKALKKMGSSLNTQAFSNLPYEPSLLAARLTQIDYDQEIVLLVLDRQLNEILALVRIEKINEDEKILACSFGMAPEFYDHIGVLLDCVITYSKMVGINKIITEAVHSLLQEPYKKAGFELVKSAKKGMNLMVRNIA